MPCPQLVNLIWLERLRLRFAPLLMYPLYFIGPGCFLAVVPLPWLPGGKDFALGELDST